MKRYLFFVMIVLCFSVLLGCAQAEIGDQRAENAAETTAKAKTSFHFTAAEPDKEPPVTVTQEVITVITEAPVHMALVGFSEFLDREKLCHSMSQSAFCDRIERYTYEGKTILKTNGGFFFDGVGGGGLAAHGDLFGFENRAEFSDYTNELYTRVPLDGLVLPFEIAFADTLTTVLEKVGYTETFWLPESDEIVLVSNERSKLSLLKTAYEEALAAVKGRYELIYAETYRIVRQDGRKADVTRQITFGFDENQSFSYFHIRILDRYGSDDSYTK